MNKDKIRKETKKIKESASLIDDEVEDKEVKAYGDPVVELS